MKLLPDSVLHLTLATLAAACLSGCNHSAGDAPGGASSKSAAPKQTKDAKGLDPDMVSAVNLAGSSTNLISMKFKLAGRPHATTPVQVTLQLIPAPDTQINRVQLSMQPGEGLLLQSEQVVELTDFQPNTPLQQVVTVIPQRNGLLSLSATIQVSTDDQSLSRTYSIPLIVADSHG